MKKIIYRILLISLFIIITITIKSYGASDFSYTIDASGNAIITAYNGTESNVTIPSTIDGHNVKTIDSHAFDGRTTNGKNFVNVTVSEGITKIDAFAFVGCEKLQSVILPDSVTSLGFQTFLGCINLATINIPKNVTTIPNLCFQETAISEIIIPEGVEKMDSSFQRL